jgi:hypothetical protein
MPRPGPQTPGIAALPLLLALAWPRAGMTADPVSPPSPRPIASADPTAPDPAAPGLWHRTREVAGDLWERSRTTAEHALAEARDILADPNAASLGRIWQELAPRLDRTPTLEDRQEAPPQTAWVGTDQASKPEAIDALLDEAVTILSTARVQDLRRQIRRLQTRMEEARQDIDALRRERISAPDSSLVRRTVADCDRGIHENTEQIARDRAALDALKASFAQELRGIGLQLRDDQVEMLLATVVGDNLVDLGVVFDNVKAVTVQLEQLVQGSGEDLAAARRYYGMYVILLKALTRMHTQVEAAIAGRYVPQIDAIVTRTRDLSVQTRDLQRQSPEKTALLAANLDAQRLTLETAAVYRRNLEDQARQIAQARQALELDVAAAWNTYETVRVSGELVALVKSSQQLLQGLMDRQVPALRPFQNQEMRREFEKLTEQLRSPGPGT